MAVFEEKLSHFLSWLSVRAAVGLSQASLRFRFSSWISLLCPLVLLFPSERPFGMPGAAQTRFGGAVPSRCWLPPGRHCGARRPHPRWRRHVTARPAPSLPGVPGVPRTAPRPGSAAGAAGRSPSRCRHGGPGLLPLAQPQVPLHYRQLRRGEGEQAAQHGTGPLAAAPGRLGRGGRTDAEPPVLSPRCCPRGLPRGLSKAGRWVGGLELCLGLFRVLFRIGRSLGFFWVMEFFPDF